jgi:hypothetical protein
MFPSSSGDKQPNRQHRGHIIPYGEYFIKDMIPIANETHMTPNTDFMRSNSNEFGF